MSKRIPISEPVTAEARELRERVSPKRWRRIVRKAQEQASLVMRVREKSAAEGLSLFQALRVVSPTTSWPSFQYWCKRVGDGQNVSWEALLDHRMPPGQTPIPEVVRASAVTIMLMRPDIGYQEARDALVAQHGPDLGDISASSFSRIWQAAGLVREKSVEPDMVEFHGGAGLALIGAASLETGSTVGLANAILVAAQETAERQPDRPLPVEPAGRDAKGRLTADYNKATREGIESGQQDTRWEPDYKKRQDRNLAGKRVLQERPESLAEKALAVGATALITERRGFAGLDGIQGEWLQLLSGGVPYKPRTLDKFVAQLGMLDVEDGLWNCHAAMSVRHASRWAMVAGGPPWLIVVVYIDATQDPYWTRKYALSGKISRTGRVGPCLSRIAVNAGPGVPFLMETYPGSVSLKNELPRLLKRVESIVGEDVRRLTIIDAEMSTSKLLTALSARDESGNAMTPLVTVLKGRSFDDFKPTSEEWQEYRKRDRIREGTLVIHGDGAPKGGLPVRVVEMCRSGRHEQSTFFATTNTVEELSTSQVVDAYLSRWPNQEHLFRNSRNGLGLNHSHGFSGEKVHHVALDAKKEKAQGQLQRAEARQAEAQQAVDAATAFLTGAKKETDKESRRRVLKVAQRELSAATKAVSDARKSGEKLNTTSQLIYERDTARENVVTAFTMNVLFLIEFVLREYFGGLRVELRTFIEHFVNLPVSVITTDDAVTYRVHANPRNLDRTEQVRNACEEVTRRGLTRGQKRLVFVVAERERKHVKH